MERILIIDDDEKWIEILTRELQFRCYQVYAENTARKGLETAVRLAPDLIMVDIKPEGPGGFEVISRLAGDERTREIPVVILTARTRKHYVEQARKLGVCDFISREDFHLGRMLSTVQLAILRRYAKMAPEHSEPALTSRREDGVVYISFQAGITGRRFRDEAKSVLNKAFLTRIQKEECVLDLRRVPTLNDLEFQALESYLRLFGRPGLAVIAGAHFGELILRAGPKMNVFLSCGDYLLQADSKKFQAKATAV